MKRSFASKGITIRIWIIALVPIVGQALISWKLTSRIFIFQMLYVWRFPSGQIAGEVGNVIAIVLIRGRANMPNFGSHFGMRCLAAPLIQIFHMRTAERTPKTSRFDETIFYLHGELRKAAAGMVDAKGQYQTDLYRRMIVLATALSVIPAGSPRGQEIKRGVANWSYQEGHYTMRFSPELVASLSSQTV